jgi:PAS domain S-box-containing protein
MSKLAAAIEYRQIFNCTVSAILVIDTDAPVYTILDVNEAYLSATNSNRSLLVGESVFAAFPANPTDEVSKNIERAIYSFEQAIQTRKPHTMSNYRYDIPVRGTGEFEERYWTTTNTPILDEQGRVKYFIHSPANVTAMYKLAERERAGIEALKNQRKQLYSIFMQAPVGIGIFLGPDYQVELINPPLCALYGKSIDEMLGKPVFEVLHHAKGLGFEQLLDQVRLTGEPFYGERMMVPLARNGQFETAYVNFVYEPFREDDGSISGVIAIATEITGQVMASRKLEEAEERARLAVDAVGLGTFDLNLETGETVTSVLFANIFGFEVPVPPDEYRKRIHPDDLEMRRAAHEQARQTGVLFYEARLIWPDESIRWIRIEGRVYYTSEQSGRILGTALDITQLVVAEQVQQKLVKQVADNEQLLRSITSATPTGLWMTDTEGHLTYVNQTWVDWTGLDYQEHMGTGWMSSIVLQDHEMTKQKFSIALVERTGFEVEFRFRHADEKVHWAVVSGRPQFDEDGSFKGYIGALVDITELKHLQQQKDDFIGIASHELKTPVTSIKAYAQLLERMLVKSGHEKDAGLIRKMDGQINRLTSLIGDLLDVTKLNSGKLQFNDRKFDFNALVSEQIDELQHVAGSHTLIAELAPTGIVFGDRERIGQVITNLITNAVKYSPQAERIMIMSSIKDGAATLCVRDFGIGISKMHLGKVFEQFYRVSGNQQHTFAGLGLGLYISSEIMKREGGKIWVTSEEGRGSTFCFSLPLTQSAMLPYDINENTN